MIKIGIIGGSGLENPEILENAMDVEVNTPYGEPSSPLKTGKIKGVSVAILSRHGREHTIPPTQVNYRANIYAMKKIGCTHILATTAVGSLREEIRRGDLLVIDQFIDFTKHRVATFYDKFEPHTPEHVPMAEPFDKKLSALFVSNLKKMNIAFHEKGTVVTIEGPRFSTKAESKMFRLLGADIINMSIAPECALANEVKIPYAAIAMSTDYDCWKDDEAPVTWQAVFEVFKQNVKKVTDLLLAVIPEIK